MRKGSKNSIKGPVALTCRSEETEPLREFLAKIGDKWSVLLVVTLSRKPNHRARFSELQRSVDGISQRMLAYTLLVEALRLHLTDESHRGQGWLPALADKRMRAALSSMHQEPAHAWTVQELAHTVGMSRTAFAQTFKRFVGSSPMEYLTKWRMTLAAKRIQDPDESIASLAPSAWLPI